MDRAAAYGDGLFETLLLHHGRSPLLNVHRGRLNEGARRLGLRLPPKLWSQLEACFESLSETPFAVAKLSIWRLSAGRGYAPSSAECHAYLSVYEAAAPWSHHGWREGAYLELSKVPLAMDPNLAGMKHLNRLSQVLAAAELGVADEHLMLDTSGQIIEGTKSNIIVINRIPANEPGGGNARFELLTPRLDQAGVDGVARQALRDAIAAGQFGDTLRWREGRVTPLMLTRAAEVLVCNSIIGIWPVRRIGCVHKPDPVVARRLQEYWRTIIEGQ